VGHPAVITQVDESGTQILGLAEKASERQTL